MKKALFVVSLFVVLTACVSAQQTPDIQSTAFAIVQTGVALTQTALPTFTPTATIVSPTPSAIPTFPPPPILTPDAIQVERWKEYQTELAKALFSFYREGYDPEAYKDALCEWDILGQSNEEVYIFVVCMVAKGTKDARSPVIIHLESNGAIQKVKLPESKGDHSSMFNYDPFPKDVREKFCYYFDPFPSDLPSCTYYGYSTTDSRPRLGTFYSHIEHRKTHPNEPPLVIISRIITP